MSDQSTPNEVSIEDFMVEMVNNPSLPQGGVVQPVTQQVQDDELLATNPAI